MLNSLPATDLSTPVRFAVLPRLLYWLTLGCAAALVLLVNGAPFLDAENWRVLDLMAHDAVVRRTALASAIGLIVTACVFFRQPAAAKLAPRKPAVVLPPRQPILGA